MKKRDRMRWICAVLAAAVLLTGGLTADAAGASFQTNDKTETSGDSQEISDAKNNLSNAQDEVKDIKAERRSAQQRLNSLKADKADLEAYIKELDQNLTEVQDTIEKLAVAMDAKQTEITATQAALEEAKETERRQYEAMKLRIQFMYENGDIQYLELLFEAKSLTDFLNRTEYITGMMEYDREMLTAYQQTCQEITDTEAKLEQEYAELEELKAVNEASKADLEELMEVKNAELKSYQEKINSAEAEVNSYTQALKEQEALIKQIEADIKRQEEEEERRRREEEERRQQEENNSSGGNGGSANSGSAGGQGSSTENPSDSVSFQWPLPDSSRITSQFGNREEPIAGVGTYHKGVDIGAPTGTKIYAAASGTVVISQYNYSAGNYVMINHGDGVYTVYMHCSKLLVKVGDKVSQGDNIALVGSTGYSTAPHLHFGVRIDGVYKNPLNYVSAP